MKPVLALSEQKKIGRISSERPPTRMQGGLGRSQNTNASEGSKTLPLKTRRFKPRTAPLGRFKGVTQPKGSKNGLSPATSALVQFISAGGTASKPSTCGMCGMLVFWRRVSSSKNRAYAYLVSLYALPTPSRARAAGVGQQKHRMAQ